MERKYLEELGLDKELIDKIMSEHGKSVEKQKNKIEELDSNLKLETQKYTTLEEQKKANDELIKKFESDNKDNDELQKVIDQLKVQSEKDKADYESKINAAVKEKEDAIYNAAVKDLFDDVQFASNLARKAAIAEFNENRDKNIIQDGKFINGEKFIEKLRETDPEAFKEEEGKETGKQKTPRFTSDKNTNQGKTDSTKFPIKIIKY